MKFHILLSFLTIVFIALSGLAVKALNSRQLSGPDAVSSATPLNAYGGRDYNVFLNSFRIPASDARIEVVTLHLGQDVYVLLANTASAGGRAIAENMSRQTSAPLSLTVPCNASDAVYQEHVQAMAKDVAALGYRVTLRQYDTLYFRSMVHSGHFDIILLEKRTLS